MMRISRKSETYARMLSILIIITLICINFPATAFGYEISDQNNVNQTTENNVNQLSEEESESNNTITAESNPINSASQSKVQSNSNSTSNQIFIKHESNMPEVTENTDTDSLGIDGNQTQTIDELTSISTEEKSTEKTENGTIQNTDYLISNEPGISDGSGYDAKNNELYDESISNKEYTVDPDISVFPIKNKNDKYSIGFSKNSGENLLQFKQGSASLSMKPLDSASVAGRINKNSIMYQSIYPDIDLRYTTEESQLKEDIIINKQSEQNEFSFQLTTKNTDYNITDDGMIEFVNPETSDQIFYMARPYALDAEGKRCDSITMEISKKGILTLTVDSEWLKQATYPVTIDPTIYLAGSEVYQASAGFSNTQGQNNWYYESSSNKLYPLIWDNTLGIWDGHDQNQIGSNWQQPDDYDAIRIWKAPHSGNIVITGVCKSATGTGDGVQIKITQNSDTIFGWKFVDEQNTAGENINLCITVNVGDRIGFIVDQYSSSSGDKTNWDPVITYLNNSLAKATFTRTTTAYKLDGTQVGSNEPRYENGKFDQGIMMKEGTSNLLTENQSSAETDTTGWSKGGTNTTMSKYSGGWNGNYCIRSSFNTADSWVGFSDIPNEGNTTYTFSVYAKGTSGKQISLRSKIGSTETGSSNFTLTDTWQRRSYTFTVNSSTPYFSTFVRDADGTAYSIQIDGCQLEKSTTSTPWMLGGSTRAETLTIPTSEILNATQGSIEISAYIDPLGVHAANQSNPSTIFAVGVIQKSPYLIKNQISIRRQSNSTNWHVYFSNANGQASTISLGSITTAGWYSFGVTWQAGVGGYGYLNGVNKGSVTASYLPVAIPPTVAYVGSRVDGSGQLDQRIDDLRISNRKRSDAEILATYQSNQALSLDESSTCLMNFDGNLNFVASTYSSADAIDFNRSSIAYKQNGAMVSIDTPRYETGKFKTAIRIEEGTTNLLTQNQSNAETNLTGWNVQNATTSRVSDAWQENNCVLCNLNAGDSWVGFTNIPFETGATYTFSIYAKGIPGKQISLRSKIGTTESGSPNFTLTDTWQRYSYTFTTNGSPLSFSAYIRDANGTAQSLYVDGCQIEKLPYATTWMIGGQTRTAETMTIPRYGVINSDQGSIELSAFIDPNGIHNATNAKKFTLFSVGEIQASPYLEKNQISIRRQTNSTNWYVYFSNGSGQVASINLGSITSAGWYNFGLTWQAGIGGDGYLNGVKKGSVSASYLPTAITPSVSYLGSWLDGTNQFDQLIDDLRISNRKRTDAEILAGYQSNQPLTVDANTTCKVYFDDNNPQSVASGTKGYGIQTFWNYTSASLGGDWHVAANTYNLNMLLSKPLFQLPGRGVAINESITYNSQDTGSVPLGTGWHLGSDSRIMEKSDGSVIYVGSDGSTYQYTPDGSGGYTAPIGIYLKLEKDSVGHYKITDKKQNVMLFADGKPIQITDLHDNTTTYSYDANGRLWKQRDPSAREFTYAYNSDGQLISVTDFANRVHTFGYQNGLLVSVTDPENNVSKLAYDANGHLSSVTDPLLRVTSFVFNSDGKLQTYKDARSSTQDVYQTTFAQALVNDQMVTTVTDPGNRITKYYSNSTTGNLLIKQNKVSDSSWLSWNYTWENNNLTSATDAKGTTSYEYDDRGNTTRMIGAEYLIEERYYYNDKNQLTERVYNIAFNGVGQTIKYHYDDKGNLLSTSNPDIQESDGKLYDQYGNIIQSSAPVSAQKNFIKNGSFEIGGQGGDLTSWTRVPGNAVVSYEGFNSHGNYALKLSSNTNTTDLFYQEVPAASSEDKLTLRVDVKLENVQNYGGSEGVIVKLDYGTSYDSYILYGTGQATVIIPSYSASSTPKVYIGLNNTKGTVWFDGLNLDDAYSSINGYFLSAYNSVENSGFEDSWSKWTIDPNNQPTLNSDEKYSGNKSAELILTSSGITSIYQDIPFYSGESLTFSGMVKTVNVTGKGAYCKIDFYNNTDQFLSSVQTGYLKVSEGDNSSDDFARLSCLAVAPEGAYYGRLSLILEGTGEAYFDAIKLVPRNTTRYTYDQAGNYVLNSEDALGKKALFTYDNNRGTLASSTDALNHTTNYSYDDLDRLVKVTDPLINETFYGYDGANNLITIRDPRSSGETDVTYRTNFLPNNLNMLANVRDPLNQNTVNTYDRSGNLISINLPNGKTQSFTYDGANRLTQKTLDGGTNYIYIYDGANNLIRVTDQNNQNCSWVYDSANRVTDNTDSLGYHIDYGYDKSSKLLRENDVNYNYRSDDQLKYVLYSSRKQYFDYDENGRLFQIRIGTSSSDSIYRQYLYHPNGWLSQIQDKGMPEKIINYSYYDNGNISSISSYTGTENYIYDNLGRITSWQYTPTGGNSTQESYSYDEAGNLLTKGNRTFDYNNANQIIGFYYDANGNLINDGTNSFTYDAENKLVQVNKVSDNRLVATYTYYYNGLRKSKTVNGVTTYYNWDAFGRMVRESYSDSNQETIYYYYDDKGNLIAFIKDGINYNYHMNLRGDILSITYGNNLIKAQYSYDPWGKQLFYSGTITQSFRYAGYYYDEETGLYYLQSRYYSPTSGRFLTRDAYGYIDYMNPQTLNLYAYCGNNPVNMTDPTGQIALVDDAAEGALLAVFFAALSVATLAGSEAAAELQEKIVKTVSESIEAIQEKAKTIGGPPGVQYSLRAAQSGYYLNLRGGATYLNAGDVWKYGETTNQNGRYSQTWLNISNLIFTPEYYGNQYQCKAVEKTKILNYFIDNSTLPPGNKIFK